MSAKFKVGDLLADKVLGDTVLVLERPGDSGYYKIYYCTGPVAGEMVLEVATSMHQKFKIVSGKENAKRREWQEEERDESRSAPKPHERDDPEDLTTIDQ